MSGFEQLLAEWDGMGVFIRRDAPTESWIFIALHDTRQGPALGGCRMRVYPTPVDGLRDALRLAEGMTQKWAVIGFPYGGGKAVLALSRPLQAAEREGLLRRFGRVVESLNGSYATGEDLGTTPADLALVAEETSYVHGIDRGTGRSIDPGPHTALGVFAAMRASLQHLFGDPELRDRTVLVQGIGDVGLPLVRLLRDAGASVLASDTDAERMEAATRLGAAPVAPEAVYAAPCDVFAPCAVGAILNADTVPLLQCRVVVGSANNQLAESEVAEQLHTSGILYAPDYVVNAGGAIALPMFSQGASEAEVRQRVEQIGVTLGEILREAAARSESPLHAAQRRVEQVLAR